MLLSWVLFSFYVSDRVFFFVATWAFLPVYGFVFIIIYGMRTPGLRDIEPFASCSEYFVDELKYPVTEQAILFANLTLLFISIGCMKNALEYPIEQ